MVPLASTVEEAKRRLETYDCYDGGSATTS
jgi:hypothetical protein